MLSGIVQLADINDFINPSQSCVKPLIDKNSTSTKINLADCLACNGCVTSAETILIQEHSLDKHFELSKGKLSLLLFSNQVLESLSSYYKISYQKCIEVINLILKPDFIFSLDDIINYTLNLCYEEFVKRKNSIICSECPGWICYAEKKVGKIAFEFMSTIKSPQQIMSIILRSVLEAKNINSDDVYICSLMQCFDKKIESVRNKNEINCVLSTIEIKELFEKAYKENTSSIKNVLSLNSFINILNEFTEEISKSVNLKECIIQKNTFSFMNPVYHSKENFSSNSYVEYFIYRILKEHPNYLIERKEGKNIDIREITIYTDKKEIFSKFCVAYGFRNIQNIVRNLKRKKINYDYIELMACPGGCINGGGQLREESSVPRKLLNEINERIQKDKDYYSQFIMNDYSLINIYVSQKKEQFLQQFHEIEYSMTDLKW